MNRKPKASSVTTPPSVNMISPPMRWSDTPVPYQS
jgi:hypothetical protein